METEQLQLHPTKEEKWTIKSRIKYLETIWEMGTDMLQLVNNQHGMEQCSL